MINLLFSGLLFIPAKTREFTNHIETTWRVTRVYESFSGFCLKCSLTRYCVDVQQHLRYRLRAPQSSFSPGKAHLMKLLLHFTLIVVATNWARGDSAFEQKPDVRVSTAMDAINANKEMLGAIEFDLRIVQKDKTITEETQVTKKMGRGEVTEFLSPIVESSRHGLIAGRNARFETNDPSGIRAYFVTGNIWHEVDPKRKFCILRRLDQMPGLSPMDPFELLSHNIKLPLADIMASALSDSIAVRQSDGAFESTFVLPGELKAEIVFDRSKGYLPVESTLRDKQGSVVRFSSIEYQFVNERKAWFPSSAAVYAFDAKAMHRSFDASNAIAEMVTVVERYSLLSSDEAVERLVVQCPEGYRSVNVTRDEEKPKVDGQRSVVRLLFGLIGLLVVGLIGYRVYLWRR